MIDKSVHAAGTFINLKSLLIEPIHHRVHQTVAARIYNQAMPVVGEIDPVFDRMRNIRIDDSDPLQEFQIIKRDLWGDTLIIIHEALHPTDQI